MQEDNYNDTNRQFPSDDISPDLKKQAKYCLDWTRAAYYTHKKNQGGITNTKERDIPTLRLYAQGRQSMDKYLDILSPKNKASQKRKTYMDLSLDPISVIPKFRSIVIGKFLQYHHDIEANAVDENSSDAKRKMRYNLWAKAELKRMLEPYQTMMQAGIEDVNPTEILPKTIDELNMLESVGSFKLVWETGMELLLKDSFNSSDWENIKYRVYEDLFDIGTAATRDFTNQSNMKAETRYVDVARLIMPYSKEHKKTNIDYAGEILDVTFNQIRTEAGNDIPDKDIERIIENRGQSDTYNFTTTTDFYNTQGNSTVRVLDMTWKTIDIIKQEKRTDSRGEDHYNNVSFDYNKKITPGKRELLIGKMQMVYKCKWIIGTDYVYDFGVEEDILRPTPKTVRLPFNIYTISEKSMLELIIPHEDNLNLAWLKFQNTLAKSAPPGIAVDISALKNVTNGVNNLTPLEVLQIRRETGDLLFSATTHHNQVLNPNAGKPIFDLLGGAGSMLQEQMKIIDFNITMIRQLTGINEMMDASAPAPNTLVGTAQIAEQGTNNTLYLFYNAYKNLKEGSASNLSYRIQYIIQYVDYNIYVPIIGMAMTNVFRQGSPIAESSYGITLKLKPQDAEKARMMQRVEIAFAQKLIGFSDSMYLENIIENGSLKQARIFLSYKEQQVRDQEAKASQANVQAQSQAIMEQQKNSIEGNKSLDDNKSKNKINELAAKAEMDAREYKQRTADLKEQDDNRSKNKVTEDLMK